MKLFKARFKRDEPAESQWASRRISVFQHPAERSIKPGLWHGHCLGFMATVRTQGLCSIIPRHRLTITVRLHYIYILDIWQALFKRRRYTHFSTSLMYYRGWAATTSSLYMSILLPGNILNRLFAQLLFCCCKCWRSPLLAPKNCLISQQLRRS